MAKAKYTDKITHQNKIIYFTSEDKCWKITGAGAIEILHYTANMKKLIVVSYFMQHIQQKMVTRE